MKLVVKYKYMNYTVDETKALALVTLITYITNYVTSISLMIFWYYLPAPVANLWKETHQERNVPVPLEQGLFYKIHTLIIG